MCDGEERGLFVWVHTGNTAACGGGGRLSQIVPFTTVEPELRPTDFTTLFTRLTTTAAGNRTFTVTACRTGEVPIPRI